MSYNGENKIAFHFVFEKKKAIILLDLPIKFIQIFPLDESSFCEDSFEPNIIRKMDQH